MELFSQGRSKARQKKMYQIAQLLEIPGQAADGTIPAYSNNLRTGRTPRPLFTTINRVPGFAAALRRDSMPSGSVSRSQMTANRSAERYKFHSCVRFHFIYGNLFFFSSSTSRTRPPTTSRESSKSRSNTPKSRDGSPRMPRPR